MILYFIRHTAVAVPTGTCYGQTDVALAETFEKEAKTVQEQIKSVTFDGVFTSPLTRCIRLTHYCGFSDAMVDKRLLELNFGDWEMQRWDAIDDPHLAYWYKNYVTAKTTGGESFNDLYQRFCEFIQQLPNTMERLAIFTHGGIINCARVYAKKTTLDTMFNDTPSYGSITKLSFFHQ